MKSDNQVNEVKSWFRPAALLLLAVSLFSYGGGENSASGNNASPTGGSAINDDSMQVLRDSNFNPLGTVVSTDNGYVSDGDMSMEFDSFQQTFKAGVLDVSFDAQGKMYNGDSQISQPVWYLHALQ